jgi:hypothetical protein
MTLLGYLGARHYDTVKIVCFRQVQSAFGLLLLLFNIINTRRARFAHVKISFFIQKSDLKSSRKSRKWEIRLMAGLRHIVRWISLGCEYSA